MKCPKCNTTMKWDGLIRTSCPPMYMHKCPECGYSEFLTSIEEEQDNSLSLFRDRCIANGDVATNCAHS